MDEIQIIFSALSENNRLRILGMLFERDLCVCEITKILELSTSTVSNHLAILKNAGFVTDEKEGKWVNYSLNLNSPDPKVQQLLLLLKMWIAKSDQFEQDRSDVSNVDRNDICGR